jgi:peptide deformylase
MVGVKGKSGRHKNVCCCGGCTERKAKKLAVSMNPEIAESDSSKKVEEGCC